MERTYKILKLIIWILLFAVIIVGASVLYNHLRGQMEPIGLATETTSSETQHAAKLAPDFTF